MSLPEVAQLEMLARVDGLIERLSNWAATDVPWEPMQRAAALVRRLLDRIEGLRVRLEAPLVVATFGGTGTGKSTLVNALIGREITAAGRERPTTRRPVLIAHPQTELEPLGLELDEFNVVRADAPVLRDIVIIDCPDPDTSETDAEGTNLERLHRLLPHCDVLIYASTQQKYRSARVVDELGEAATGCRLVFVQTHADLNSDVRDDWRKRLSEHYEVPDVFFVDSVRALEEQRAGRRPSGDFARLQDLLTTQLAAAERVRVRRANLIDLIQGALEHCRTRLDEREPEVERLRLELEAQRRKLLVAMSDQLSGELKRSHNLWERRLLTTVTRIWGVSPFSAMLRFYNGLGNLIASMTLFRARNSAQMALVGALQGAKWIKSKQSERDTESRLERLSSFGLDDDVLRESQFVIEGYVRDAGINPELADDRSMDGLRSAAAGVEDRFLGDAGRRIDAVIEKLAEKNSGFFVRVFYELLFGSYLAFIVYRVGRNFFYDSFWNNQPLLPVDFFVAAGVFLALWSGLLFFVYTRRLRRGLKREVDALAESLAQKHLAGGLFPQLDEAASAVERCRGRLHRLCETTTELRREIATGSELGAPLEPTTIPLSVRKNTSA